MASRLKPANDNEFRESETIAMIDYTVDGAVATITWNMADRSMNVLNAESVAAFGDAVDRALGDDSVAGVIVTSAKADFMAGADLNALIQLSDARQVMDMCMAFHELTRRIETGGKPFVAAINGTALGGGLEICLACHRRVAADNPKTRIGQPEIKVGLFPGGGGTQRLARMLGARAALPLMLDGTRLDPAAALKAGLVDEVVPADELLAAARAWLGSGEADPVKPWDRKDFRIPGGGVWSPGGAQTLIGGNAMLRDKTWGNYPAAQAIMSCVYEGLQVPIDVGLRIEARWFTKIVLGATAKNMIRSMFFHIGDANKLRRRPEGVPAADYGKIGVLGAGMMGAGIAHVSAMAGLDVVLLDSTAALAEKGKGHSAALLAKRVARGRMSEEARDAVLARIRPSTDYADLAGCELVIEAVFEDRAVKADVTKKAEAAIGEDALFASNTSTLPITGLAEASARPNNFIGLHFFSPVDRMPLVEIIRGRETSDACLARAMDFVKRIGKTPIVVNDSRGFYTSRVFGTYIQEGFALLAEGVTPALIDNAGRLAGMPVGPLAVADEVSLELIHKVGTQTRADLGDKYVAGPGDPVIQTMVGKLGRLGKKSGKGFYDYPEKARKHLWPGLAETFSVRADQPDVEEVKRRLLYIQSIETARCLADGVLEDAADADVGSILGWGFAPFTGGALSLIDTVGVADFVTECDRLAQRYGARFAPPDLLRDMAAKGARFHDDSKLAA